jgi:predicted alpha/beta hydrolase family esterase
MKATLFHGTGCTPDSYWFPYIKKNLEERGYEVEVPVLPNAENPSLADWLPVALKGSYDEDTILIGHSSGSALILSLLENIQTPVHQAVLVAGFFEPLDEGKPEPMVQETYDWEKIKSNCRSFVFINSDNDPWGCTDAVGKYLVEKLGGVLVVPHGEGHMGSTSFNQPYKEFPLLLKLID